MSEEQKTYSLESLMEEFSEGVTLSDNKEGFEDFDNPSKVSEAELLTYENYRENKDEFDVAFNAVIGDGVYIHNENGISIRAKQEDFLPYLDMQLDVSKRANLLGTKVSVTVKEVDADNGIVWVEAVKKEREFTELQLKRHAALDGLKAKFDAGEKSIKVFGTVRKVGTWYVLMDVLNLGFLCRIPVANWSKGFVRNIQNVVFPGEPYTFNITGRRYIRGTNIIEWTGEHESYTSDPWEGVPNYVDKSMVLSLTCVQIEQDRGLWWGIPTDRTVLPERVEVLVKANSKIPVAEGKNYQCTITYVDATHHIMRAATYREDTKNVSAGLFVGNKEQ